MNQFNDLYQRIALLNSILDPVRHHLGSEVREIAYRQLWDIVGQLNRKLILGLDNNALDLNVSHDQIVIHYWRSIGGGIDSEETICIDESFSVEKQSRCASVAGVRPE